MRKQILDFIKKNWAYVVSIIFFWVIPIIMLSEIVALTKHVSDGIKVTFMGCIVILVVFLALRKKIFALINKMNHGLLRGLLLCITKLITYALILGILWAISSFSNKFFHWWTLVGVSWLFGLIFVFIDEKLNSDSKENKNET